MFDLAILLGILLMFQVTYDSSGYIRLITIQQLNNTKNLYSDEIGNLLLQKKRAWISMPVTIHKGLNSKLDWSRKRCTE